MNKIKKFVKWACLLVAGVTAFSSCIRDEGEACESYLKFVYKYNLLDVDAFHKQASNIDAYLFDEAGNFLVQVQGMMPSGLDENTYRMTLPKGYEHTAQVVVWAGLNNRDHIVPTLTSGVSTMNDLKVAINAAQGDEVSVAYNPAFWGLLEIDGGLQYNNETNIVQMKKNTNAIRVLLQVEDADDTENTRSISPDEFEFRFYSVNGSASCHNECFDGIRRTYAPHYTATESLTRSNDVAIAEISTKRMLIDNQQTNTNKNLLQIVHKSTGDVIFGNTDKGQYLNQYLRLAQLLSYSQYDFQEYLDRQDSHEIIIILSRQVIEPPEPPEPPGPEDPDPDPEYRYIATNIKILGWVEREQGVDQ